MLTFSSKSINSSSNGDGVLQVHGGSTCLQVEGLDLRTTMWASVLFLYLFSHLVSVSLEFICRFSHLLSAACTFCGLGEGI